MTTAIRYKVFCLFLLLVVACGIVFWTVPSSVYAQEPLHFDQTNVLDDLTSSTVNGEAFDIKDYPYDESKDIQLIQFVEYCYSYKANMRGNYGLYVYIYNPKGLSLATKNSGNKIQMACAYDADGNPNNYVKFDLQFLSKSEDSNYKNLFYKFKVVDKPIEGKTFAERVNSNERRYDISGIELVTSGADNAKEYAVNGTFKFTGYAQGYGPVANETSTLSCKIEYLESVTLDVKHTFYRTKTSAKGAGYQNQLDTVYFAVPQRFFDTYGKLQRIKAEWYEYKTNDIVVTSNADFYSQATPYIGRQIGSTRYDSVLSLGQQAGSGGGGLQIAKWGWNLGSEYMHTPCDALCYLFKVNDIAQYDPYADTVSIGGVESNALYEYIKNYNKSFRNGTLPIKDGTISADLFAPDIDDYRKADTEFGKIQNGYSYYDFDADVDLQKLSSWQEGNPSFWDNWLNWGLWDAMFGNIPEEESRTVPPIYTLKASDLNGTDQEIAERLMMHVADVPALKKYYNDAQTVSGANDEKKAVVLFRFATSDYYSAPVDIIQIREVLPDVHTSGQAYRAWESVFLDFDIIQLTFNRDGVYKVIPVVSSPIDIVNAVTPPVQMPDDLEWWQILVGILVLILLIVLFALFLPIITRILVWLIMLPFRLIAGFVRLVTKPQKNRKKRG